MKIFVLTTVVALLFLLNGCRQDRKLFQLVEQDDSGIHFSNVLLENDTLNALKFEYLYNGAGLGVADFNNDGLSDIFFAGNINSSALYLNKGSLTFEDISDAAGVKTNRWCAGVSIVDINKDGLLDIYVSTAHPNKDKKVPNIFFVNQGLDENGIPRFKDLAVPLGLADSSYSTQAVFFDYDLDSDLDMFLLTNSLESYHRNTPFGQHTDGSGKSVDKLYRQDTHEDGTVHFTDVSASAGILEEGWGLGVVVNDFNQDGWPDVYCANDFLSSDQLYMNQHDGTFKNEISAWMNHQEFNGMGTDMADLNNDALNDLVVVDMMPDDNLRQKTMFSWMGYERFMKSLKLNYRPQYIRNVLQRNNGNNTFSDIGYQSGIYATDWSWSPLIADFDNDGLRDIFISNGYLKDITDLDFVTYNQDVTMFGTDSLKAKNAAKVLKELGGVFKPDFLFQNKGDFQFESVGNSWGLSEPTYSNGAAYADFDNDGDLDLILNNLNGVARLYQNTITDNNQADTKFLQLQLRGDKGNPQGIGTRIWVYGDGQLSYGEQQLQRGYLSSVDPVMHFGLGSKEVDSLVIVWPGGKMQVMRDVSVNTRITAFHDHAVLTYQPPKPLSAWLEKEESTIATVMPEEAYADYKFGQATLPHKFSQQGPRLAVGDINGDGLDDFVVGGTAYHSAMIYQQQADGKFHVDSLAVKTSEDVGILLFDADKDGDLDLYCVSGSSEFGKDTSKYQDRLYKNNGKGKFQLDKEALPKIESSGSCVTTADVDHDGDLDLFVGGRVVPAAYPSTPRSYLLRNTGQGKFEDVTSSLASGLDSVGMVTDALFTDFNNDGWQDLIVVGEWMPVTVFGNDKGVFKKTTELKTGWWSSIAAGDFDNDGDTDYILGNLGKNSVLRASEQEPVSIYAKDFDANGSLDPFISRYIQGKEHPVHYRETMTEQIPALRRILRTYSKYGKMEMGEILKYLGEQDMIVKRATCFESSYLENQGKGNFSLHALPLSIQVSPMNSIAVGHLNDDPYLDFLAVGNSFAEETLSGYLDAGIGVYALGNGDGTFQIIPPSQSGFCVMTDAKAIEEIKVGNKRKWIVTSNQAPLIWFGDAKQDSVKQLALSPQKH
ncbi:VCBS repeat-containing protein [Chryseolinea lacunae]|uniref:VCBS repeat-containing protein n=1 Tax=Chryseolinea lacunae TaxID=2801331 RepID=A0ABS1KYW0_9BACT|nr:VCBS repeat-containing protein [Chryseolinea lacunae]MBL0744645.1 VCBS repeat-containing protein [Chryseolinea lacunae]